MKFEKFSRGYYNWTFYISLYVVCAYFFYNFLFKDYTPEGLLGSLANILFLQTYFYFLVIWFFVSLLYILKLYYQKLRENSLFVIPCLWLIPMLIILLSILFSIFGVVLPDFMETVFSLIAALPLVISIILFLVKINKKEYIDISRVFKEKRRD